MLRGGVKAFGALPRVIEKSSRSSDLGNSPSGPPPQRSKTPPRLQVELVCQDETARFDPFWDGPRLVPAFAAQLMAQVMESGREIPASAQAAYTAAAPRAALLFEG